MLNDFPSFFFKYISTSPFPPNQQQQKIFKDVYPKGMGIIKLKPLKQDANNNTAKIDYSYIKFTTKKKKWNISLGK